MTADLRWLWARLNANYWFYPALFALTGAALAFGLVWLDRHGFADWLADADWLVPARPDGASNMLTVISGSMIGVASTVFSITIAAVAYASGTYGPRLLTNFMEDKGNQFSLATFIGTFVYAITVLRFIRAEGEAATGMGAGDDTLPGFVPQLSLLVAYVLMALSVAVLVYFLNHVPSGIRINTVIEGIGRRLITGIEKTYPEQGTSDGARDCPSGQKVRADRPGYVQLIDFAELDQIGRKAGRDVALKVRTGDFVHPGVALAEIGGQDSVEDDLADAVRRQFNLGAARTPEQDPQFLIDELVEIGLRALSPGINDPFTAITALHWLGAATADLGCRKLEKDLFEDEAEERRLYPLPDDFAHYVSRGFGAIRGAVATSPVAAQVMLDVLDKAAGTIGDGARIGVLRAQAEKLMIQARIALSGPDLDDVEQAFTRLNLVISSTPKPLPA